jgi:hypothetical protein
MSKHFHKETTKLNKEILNHG